MLAQKVYICRSGCDPQSIPGADPSLCVQYGVILSVMEALSDTACYPLLLWSNLRQEFDL